MKFTKIECVVLIIIVVVITNRVNGLNDTVNGQGFGITTKLQMCYRKFLPNALVNNSRPIADKWLIKETIYDRTKAQSIPLDGASFRDTLARGHSKSYSVFKGEIGPLTILVRATANSNEERPINLTVHILLNETINMSDNIRMGVETRNHDQSRIYNLSLVCASIGNYRIIVIDDSWTGATLEITTKSQQKFHDWEHLSKVIPVKIRYKNRLQKKQMLIKWDKCNVDVHQIRYCVTINQHHFHKSLCAAVSDQPKVDRSSCRNHLMSLHDQFLPRKINKFAIPKKLELTGTTIVCTGHKAQQIFKRFRPNVNYYVDVFGTHKSLNNLTFHLGSLKLWNSNKNRTIPLYDGRSAAGRLSQFNDVITFSFKTITEDVKYFQLYVVPCGGSVQLKVLKQKKLVSDIRDIHKPRFLRIAIPSSIPQGDRLTIKIVPNNVDEANKNIRVELTATSSDKFLNMPLFPKNLSIFEITALRTCQSVDIFWHNVVDTREVRFCVILMKTSSWDSTALCSLKDKMVFHPRFQQTHCFYSKPMIPLERMKLTELSAKTTYMVFITATLANNSKNVLTYEPLRIRTERMCRFFQPNPISNHNNDTIGNEIDSEYKIDN